MCNPRMVRRAVGVLALSLLATTEVVAAGRNLRGSEDKAVVLSQRPDVDVVQSLHATVKEAQVDPEAPAASHGFYMGGNKAAVDAPPAAYGFYSNKDAPVVEEASQEDGANKAAEEEQQQQEAPASNGFFYSGGNKADAAAVLGLPLLEPTIPSSAIASLSENNP